MQKAISGTGTRNGSFEEWPDRLRSIFLYKVQRRHRQGSYTQITDVYAAVIAWMEANGYEAAEPMFNIYHVSPHETQNPDEFVTEICYPVKKK